MEGIPAHAPNPTEPLVAWGRGETDALNRLVPVLHHELPR
jgi:hypothetical protein